MRRPAAILIAGPTASGKSALALRLARRLGGRIINADAMQVYLDLRILTARPTEAEMTAAPHALYGTVDGATTHSVSLWLADARTEIANAKAEGRLPILVGGTGLYFKALTQGLSEIPPVPDDVRARIRAWAEGRTPADLHDDLSRRDQRTAALLRPSDPQRLLRAIEVHEATGESLASFQSRRAAAPLDIGACTALALCVDRDVLRSRIDARFDAMVAAGGLDEVRALAARNLDPKCPIMRAIGVPPLLRHVGGAIDRADAIAEAKSASRRYIRRQETFLRTQLPAFRPILAEDAEAWIGATLQSA